MMPNPNEVYKHFKGDLYKVIGVAKDSETGDRMVVYQALYGNYELYVRPLDMFMSPVDKIKYPEVKQKQRFELIGMAPADANQPGAELVGDVINSKAVCGQAASTGEAITGQASVSNTEVANTEEQVVLKPLVEAFLDADTIEEKKRILVALQDTIDQDDVTIMATVMDIEINQELELPERYRQLMKCLDTKGRFETLRLR